MIFIYHLFYFTGMMPVEIWELRNFIVRQCKQMYYICAWWNSFLPHSTSSFNLTLSECGTLSTTGWTLFLHVFVLCFLRSLNLVNVFLQTHECLIFVFWHIFLCLIKFVLNVNDLLQLLHLNLSTPLDSILRIVLSIFSLLLFFIFITISHFFFTLSLSIELNFYRIEIVL